MDFVKFTATNQRITEKFDRHNPTPPYYLTRLRNRGRWRIDDVRRFKISGFSAALGNINLGVLQNKDVIVDAGCGDSPDCAYAIKNWGFKKGFKIDLYDIGQDNEYAARDLKKLERGKVAFIKGDVCEEQAIDNDSVDLIVCNAMIDLIPKEDRVLFYLQACRILKPGGLLSIAYVPLKAGYGFDGLDELRQLRNLGFEHINGGTQAIIILKKGTHEN